MPRIIFKIVEKENTGWHVSAIHDGALLYTRDIYKVLGSVFKNGVSEPAEVPSPAGTPTHYTDDLEDTGRKLFECLIGPANWVTLTNTVTNASPLLELALVWNDIEFAFRRMPWDMMHDGTRFIETSISPLVTLTRLVTGPGLPGVGNIPDQTRESEVLREIDGQNGNRVLCIVGTDLSDAAISAGAEYLGLLRHLEGCTMGGITIRVLFDASPTRIRQEIKKFRPSVLHFICHGDFDGEGNGTLWLVSDDVRTPQEHSAQAIWKCISEGGASPLVVLNACHSAEQSNYAHSVPLAMQLVRLGAPLVIGMVGSIADSACRLFTRRFYETLSKGGCFLTATAEGRAASTFGQDHGASIFPSIFLAHNTPPKISVSQTFLAAQRVRESAANAFRIDNTPPVICDRFGTLSTFENIVENDTPTKVLGIKPQMDRTGKLGRSRLVSELAHRAVFRNMVPIVVRIYQDEADPDPTINSFDQLTNRFTESTTETASHFQLDTFQTTEIRILREWRTATPSRRAELYAMATETLQRGFDAYECIRPPTALSEAALDKAAILADLKILCASIDAVLGPQHRPVVFIDNAHRIVPDTIHQFLQLVGANGFGSHDYKVPVVVTYLLNDVLRDSSQKLDRWLQERSHARIEELTYFDLVKDRLAYEQILMLRKPPLSVRDRDRVEKMFRQIFSKTNGSPAKFRVVNGVIENESMRALIDLTLDQDFLRLADDEDLMSQLRKVQSANP